MAAGRLHRDPHDLLVGERLRAGQLVGAPARRRGDQRRHHAVGDVLGPDRLVEGAAGARDRDRRQVAEALEQREPRIAGRVDDRRAEDRRLQRRGLDRLRGQRLGPEEARAGGASAPIAEKNTKRRAPARSAALTSRSVATAFSSSIEARGSSRIAAARCTTVSTPRSAFRNEGGSARSPRAICTRTRLSPRRRGSRTRQRTGSPAPVSRLSRADPIVPVAPVSRITCPPLPHARASARCGASRSAGSRPPPSRRGSRTA